MSETLNCKICKENKPVSLFYFNRVQGRYDMRCKKCHGEFYRKRYYENPAKYTQYRKGYEGKRYQLSEASKKKANEASCRAAKKFPEKWNARVKLRYAVKVGKVIKPENCEICHEVKKLQGHHADYTKALEVQWLCSGCHAKVHKLLKVWLSTDKGYMKEEEKEYQEKWVAQKWNIYNTK